MNLGNGRARKILVDTTHIKNGRYGDIYGPADLSHGLGQSDENLVLTDELRTQFFEMGNLK